MQATDNEKKDHSNCKTYKDILVKDLEKVPNKDGSQWRRKNPESRQNEEVEFIHCFPASTFLMNPHESDHFQHDRHDDPTQIQHSPQNHSDDQLHDEARSAAGEARRTVGDARFAARWWWRESIGAEGKVIIEKKQGFEMWRESL